MSIQKYTNSRSAFTEYAAKLHKKNDIRKYYVTFFQNIFFFYEKSIFLQYLPSLTDQTADQADQQIPRINDLEQQCHKEIDN